MAFRFNRYAKGLLGLLDAKTQGEMPTDLASELRLSLDARPFYEAGASVNIVDATTVITVEGFWQGNGVLLVVPQDEIWLVSQFTVMFPAILGAGDLIVLFPALRCLGTGGANCDIVLSAPCSPTSWSSGTIPTNSIHRPFVALPGDNLGVQVSVHVTAAQVCNLFARVTKLKV